MVDVAIVVILIGVLVFLAHFFAWVFSITSIPDGLLLILVGILLSLFGVLKPEFFGDLGSVLLSITLMLILFEGGSRLHIGAIKSALGGTLKLTVLTFVATFLLVGLTSWFFLDVPFALGLAIGSLSAGTSAAVVIPLLKQMELGEQTDTMLVLESAITDVLSVVLTIAFLQATLVTDVSVLKSVGLAITAFIIPGLIGVVGGLVWSLLLEEVRHMQNSLFVTLAFIMVLFGLVEATGISGGPITALAFGVTLGNIGVLNERLRTHHNLLKWLIRPVTISRRERAFFSEIVFLLQTFFFVFVGLSIRFNNVAALGIGAGLVALMLIIRFLAVRFSVAGSVGPRSATVIAVLVPKGLATAVLATLLSQAAVPQADFIQDLAYAIILWSILASAVLIFSVRRTGLGSWYGRMMPYPVADTPTLTDQDSTPQPTPAAPLRQ